MPRKSSNSNFRAALLTAALFCAVIAAPTQAQVPALPPASAPAQFDPSDFFFQGWLLSQDAEKLQQQGKPLDALNKLRKAKQLFDTIERTFPKWRPEMLAGRQKKTLKNIAVVTPGALRELDAKNQAITELEGGARRGAGGGNDPTLLDTGLNSGNAVAKQQVQTLESRRINELEAESARLKREIEATRRQADKRSHDLAVSEFQKRQIELNQLRRNSAEIPMQGEIRALSNRIDGLEREKAVMAQALDSSQTEARHAKGQIDALQTERGRLMQEVADLKGNLETERATANQVVAGQRKQLQHFQELLVTKDKQLSKANKRIQSLETELAEVRDSFDGLRQERDDLLRERDQMAALLKLNEAGQLQQVIDQNMALDRELRETKERYEVLVGDNASTIYDLEEALRDLAISKLRIQQFRREKSEQEQRLGELKTRLHREAAALADSSGDPAETALLRSIIQRQLKIQEKRSEARDLLITTLEAKAKGDETIQRAIAIYKGAELNLSPEEMRVVDGQRVDGIIISPYARPRGDVDRSIASLQRELLPYSRAGTRAYQNGRLLAAREAFEMVIERNPGDSNAMCKLGLVEYKLNELYAAADIFRQATELDPRNPYAFRMLGHTLASIDQNSDALAALTRATELADTNSEGFLLLGNLQFRIGQLSAAEESFKIACSCDQLSAEPHYNLAILQDHRGEKDLAWQQYNKALELGAAPNLELEKRLQPDKTP